MRQNVKLNGRCVISAAIIVVLFAAVTIYGLVWTVQEGVKSKEYLQVEGTISECRTEEIDGVVVITEVIVSCVTPNESFEATFIGDYTKCAVGQNLTVYYKAADKSTAYSRSSDVGFALIMFAGGVIRLAVSAAAIAALNRSGAFLARQYETAVTLNED